MQLILVASTRRWRAGLDVPLTFEGALLVVPVSLVVQMVPLSINGFGVREAVFTYFFKKLGLSVDAALALSLISTATHRGLLPLRRPPFFCAAGDYRPAAYLPDSPQYTAPSLCRYARRVGAFRVRDPDLQVVVRSAMRRLCPS